MRNRTFMILGATLALLVVGGLVSRCGALDSAARPLDVVVVTPKESTLSVKIDDSFHHVDVPASSADSESRPETPLPTAP